MACSPPELRARLGLPLGNCEEFWVGRAVVVTQDSAWLTTTPGGAAHESSQKINQPARDR